MLVFNDSSMLTSTGPIEIAIDGFHVAALGRYEYMEIPIAPGSHVIVVRHKEFFFPKYYENTYEFEITDPAGLFMRVFTRLSSTGFMMVRELPRSFSSRFRPGGFVPAGKITMTNEADLADNPYTAPDSQ